MCYHGQIRGFSHAKVCIESMRFGKQPNPDTSFSKKKKTQAKPLNKPSTKESCSTDKTKTKERCPYPC